MRYEAGPFAGIRFFRLAEGASCAVRAISRTAGSFLRSRGRGSDCRGESSRWRSDFSYRRELLAQSGEGFGLPGRIIALAE